MISKHFNRNALFFNTLNNTNQVKVVTAENLIWHTTKKNKIQRSFQNYY